MPKNHIKQPIPKEKTPIHPSGMGPLLHKQVLESFNYPASMVNNFQLMPGASYIRMALAEHDIDGNSKVRAVVAFDYKTLVQLGQMVEQVLKQYIMMNSAPPVPPEEKSAAAPNSEALGIGELTEEKTDEEKITDDTKTSVG